MLNQRQISAILQAIKESGVVAMEYFNDYKKLSVAIKDDGSKVTNADIAVNEVICSRLHSLLPEIAIISEEADFEKNKEASKSAKFFIIDPIDGTNSFIKKSDEFSVNIALIKNKEVVFGVIYMPAKDLLFYTDHNNEAIQVSGLCDPNAELKKIATSQKKDDLIVICTKREPEKSQIIAELEERSVKEIISVSSSYKFCLIAQGVADLYPRRINISAWDVAAGHAIVKAAGGNMYSHFTKQEVEYDLQKTSSVDFFDVY